MVNCKWLHTAETGLGSGDTVNANITVDQNRIATFCRQHHIRRFGLFGSVLRPDFGPQSDIDVLVEFESGHVPSLFGISRMERELSEVFDGRNVELRTPEDLSRYFRAEVLEQTEFQYAQGG